MVVALEHADKTSKYSANSHAKAGPAPERYQSKGCSNTGVSKLASVGGELVGMEEKRGQVVSPGGVVSRQ